MIISPPFLPDLQATEEVFLDAAMVPAPDGRYPVSAGLQWHNGTHLQAPMENNQYLPVRAVADGEVIYGVSPDAQPSADPQHPQNYPAYPVSTSYPGEPVPAHRLQWTDKGLLILRHTTEIGASGNTPGNTATRVTYYSVYMHLKEFAATLKPGAKVLRKDVLGRAGQIYGQHGRIHFEICCDEANLARLLGPQRPLQWAQPDRAPTADGRTDAVFGSVYVYLPAGAPAQATKPADALRRGTPASNALAASQWVEILYQRGDATLRSYRATDDAASGQRTGDAIGSPVVEVGGEYALFDEANRRHAQALRQDPSLAPPNALAHSSPSGWLELLRFGRNLGIDPLPANAAHWRKIATPQGEVWADLNASGSFKFSDADFPAIRGWQCIADDSNPQDQRCDSTQLKLLLLTGLLGKEREETLKDRQKLQARLDQVHIRARLAQLICKFPTEWDQTSIAQRYGWHAELPEYKEDPKRLEQLMGHIRALTCNPPQEYKDAVWHFQPRAFIGMFRRCGWLSESEFTQLLPMMATRFYKPVAARNPPAGSPGHKDAGFMWESVLFGPVPKANIGHHRTPLNVMMRKHLINTPCRMAAFFGNSLQETQWLEKIHEKDSSAWYHPWDGRGFLQLTHEYNYVAYWQYRGRDALMPAKVKADLVQARKDLANARAGKDRVVSKDKAALYIADARIQLPVLLKDWRDEVRGPVDPNNRATKPTVEELLSPSESAGFYWSLMKMPGHADKASPLVRRMLTPILGAGQVATSASKTYYHSDSFRDASAAVNLPDAVGKPHIKFNGYEARCLPHAQALAILGEPRFPGATAGTWLDFPEDMKRRNK